MAEIIYGKNGTAKATAKSVRYTGQFMGVPQLEVEIDGPVPLGFEVGDYIVFSYDGIKYSIMDLPPVTKQASAGSAGNAFVYDSVVFKSPLGLLANVDFLDTVLNENNVHYSTLPVFEFYGTVKDFADRLQANINRLHTGWKVSVEGYDDSTNPNYDTLHEYSNISISNIKCSDSLSIPYETWGITYVFMVDAEGNNCIVFSHALDSTSAKRYGKGNGLYTLTKRMSAEKPVMNRLRAYGSTDNLPARYYNNLDGIDEGIYLPNLMIPRSEWKNQNDPITAYIDSTDIDENDTSMSRYGVREKSIYFDGSNGTEKIEPTIKGVTAGMIRAAKEEMGDTSNVPSATLYPDDERMDKIVEAESIADKGVESDGEVYMDSIGFNVSKGEDRTVVGTKNGLDPIIEDLETSMEISTPATYKVVSGNPTPFCRFNTGVGIAVDSAILNVYTVDEDGVKTLCDSVKIYSEVISGVNPDGGRYAYRDFYFAGSNGKDSPLYIKVPYKGVLLFQYNIVAGGADSVSLTMSAVSLTASTGPIILQNKFWVRIKQIGFDINSYPSTEEAKLVVNSGGCAGRSFNIVKNSTQFDEATGTWKFECFRSQDESLSQLFPNSIYKISEDDEFVLTGLEMPDLYVQMASQKLYDEAVKWLWKHKDGLEVFSLDIDNKVAYLDSVKIKEGMLLPLYDRNLNVGSEAKNEEGETVITYDYRIIDSVTIEIGEESIPVIIAVLREEKEESIFKSLIKAVNNVSARTDRNIVRTEIFRISEEVVRSSVPTTSASSPSVSNPDLSDFVTLSTEQTITAKKTFAGDVVLGGQKQDGSFAKAYIPSTAGAGLFYIVMDASSAVEGETPTVGGGGIDEDELWAILSGNAGTEVVAKQHLPSDTVYGDGLAQALLPYATQEWVAGRGYLTSVKLSTISDLDAGWDSLLAAAPAAYVSRWPKFSEVTERPDTIAGYGITDAYTKGEVNAELSEYVTLGTPQTVSGDKTHSGDVIFGAAKADGSGYGRMYIPSTAGAGLFYLVMDSASAVDGETPTAGGGGIDEEELWAILSGNAGTEVVSKQHLPSDTVYSDGLAQTLSPYATQEWTAGQYVKKSGDTMSGNLIVSGAAVYRKMSNDTSSAATVIGWKKAAEDTTLATIGYYNVRKAIYLNSHIYETADLWQDAVGKYTLFIGINDLTYNTYPILRSDNIGSYALTPSNYTSTLDSRYVKKAGDTMTGVLSVEVTNGHALSIKTSNQEGYLGVYINSTYKGALGYNNTHGTFLYNAAAGYYVGLRNDGQLYHGNSGGKYWHSGNDGSGSGLDADTVDGVHNGSLSAMILLSQGRVAAMTSGSVTAGMQMVEVYNNGYPCSYGNALRIGGAASVGAGELVLGWSGSNGGIEHLYYHNKRDMHSGWSEWRTIAFTTDNVASATKLATARSLWGNSFDGGQNLTGRIWAYNGINIGSLDDYGWFNSSNRISCGLNVARGCNVGSLLVSNAWADSTKVPTSGIYSKGAVVIDGTLTAGGNVIAYSSSSRLVKDILPAVSYSRRLMSLGRVVEYRYNGLIDRDRDIHTGLIYENVRDVMPSMCFMHEGYGALNYLDKDYICTIAGAVQENIDDIAYLKNRVASLEAEVERLRRGLAA